MEIHKTIVGSKFGRWEVIESHITKRKILCKCECGKEKNIFLYALKSGISKSCGCLRKDLQREREKITTHGMTGTKLYAMYRGMMSRCYSKSYENPKSYREKGITVCDEWKKDRKTFFKWALENGYMENLSIDRIDNSKGYTPENCRFADWVTQNNNRTNNVTINGMTVRNYANLMGINENTLRTRLRKERLKNVL